MSSLVEQGTDVFSDVSLGGVPSYYSLPESMICLDQFTHIKQFIPDTSFIKIMMHDTGRKHLTITDNLIIFPVKIVAMWFAQVELQCAEQIIECGINRMF